MPDKGCCGFDDDTDDTTVQIRNLWHGAASAWIDHYPFGRWLVDYVKPTITVDLGVFYGFSTFTFAEGRKGIVIGIDTFQGDSVAGDLPPDILTRLTSIRNLAGGNVVFLKGTFAEVARIWCEPIDILHIDGSHDYASVKDDFNTWSKFLKAGGVILMHDTEEAGFGVRQVFEEASMPKINFEFGHGLGVLSTNSKLLTAIASSFDLKKAP